MKVYFILKDTNEINFYYNKLLNIPEFQQSKFKYKSQMMLPTS